MLEIISWKSFAYRPEVWCFSRLSKRSIWNEIVKSFRSRSLSLAGVGPKTIHSQTVEPGIQRQKRGLCKQWFGIQAGSRGALGWWLR